MWRRALLAWLVASMAVGQTGPAFRSSLELVLVPCTVVDAKGVAVESLTRDEFRLYDNDVRRPLENLWIDNDSPLALGIIIDASDSQ